MAKIKDDYVFKLKGGEAAVLESVNPFLERREPIVVFFENGQTNIKIGDGKNNYNNLPFISDTNIDINDVHGLTEILNQYEIDIENLDEKIDEIIADIEKDMVGRKTTEGGEIFNTYEDKTYPFSQYPQYNAKVLNSSSANRKDGEAYKNKAISESSVSFGASNISGCKAFRLRGHSGTKGGNGVYKLGIEASTLLFKKDSLSNHYATWLFNEMGGNNRAEMIPSNIILPEPDDTYQFSADSQLDDNTYEFNDTEAFESSVYITNVTPLYPGSRIKLNCNTSSNDTKTITINVDYESLPDIICTLSSELLPDLYTVETFIKVFRSDNIKEPFIIEEVPNNTYMESLEIFSVSGSNNCNIEFYTGTFDISVDNFMKLESAVDDDFFDWYSFIRFYENATQIRNNQPITVPTPLVELGDTSIEGWSYTSGLNNKAVGLGSFVSGNENIADGAYAGVFGRQNIGAMNSLVGGRWNTVGQYGAAFGQSNDVSGKNSIAAGTKLKALTQSSSVFGSYNKYCEDLYNKQNEYLREYIALHYGMSGNCEVTDNGIVFKKGSTSNSVKLLTNNSEGDTIDNGVKLQPGYRYLVELEYNSSLDTPVTIDLVVGDTAKKTGTRTPVNNNHTFISNKMTEQKIVIDYVYPLSNSPKNLFIRVQGAGLSVTNTFTITAIKVKEILPITHSVGNGADESHRSNAFAVYQDGHAEVQVVSDSDNSVITKKYLNDAIGDINSILAYIVDGGVSE